MKQKGNEEEFFNKYGFTKSITMKHPRLKGEMNFEGLEADYVSHLENKVDHLERYIGLQNQNIEFLMNKEFYKWKEMEKK